MMTSHSLTGHMQNGLLALLAIASTSTTNTAHAAALSRRWQDQCSSFSLPDGIPEGIQASLTAATYYPEGALFNETSLYANLSSSSFKAFCRIQVAIETYPGSNASSEIWLPDGWNGRFLGVGNGASGGGIVWSDLGYTCVNNGFAGHSTNTGHTSNNSYAGWALDNPGAVVDFGYRAMHQGVVVAKSVVSSYYDTSDFNSFYSACSLGGRQAWQEIERYPEDFDAVLAGSPGLDDVRQSASALYVNQKLLPVNGSTWFTNNDWAVLHDEVLKQCDGLDGIEDGIVSNPPGCKFRPEAIACRPGEKESGKKCLTYEQIKVLYYVYNPWVDQNDTYVYAGSAIGSELGLPAQLPASGGQYTQDGEFFRYLVYNDSSWRTQDISYASVELGVNGVAYSNSATNPNITSFVKRGGKVIQYVGWGDFFISPYASIDWYNTVDLWMTTHSEYKTSDYFRLFIVPGMGHCSGGPGPTALGQGPYSTSPPPSNDPKYNMLWAAIAWYEQGKAPKEFIGTKYKDDNVTLGIDFQRPVCQWPLTTRYKGEGDENKAENYYCAAA